MRAGIFSSGGKFTRAALGAALLVMLAIEGSGAARASGIQNDEKNFSRDPEIISWTGRSSARNVAKAPQKQRPDARTLGLGHACTKTADCIGRAQTCLKESDANGKELKAGICALPCGAIDAGIENPSNDPPPASDAPPPPKKPAPLRCPKKFQCRSAGDGVPIDLCIKE